MFSGAAFRFNDPLLKSKEFVSRYESNTKKDQRVWSYFKYKSALQAPGRRNPRILEMCLKNTVDSFIQNRILMLPVASLIAVLLGQRGLSATIFFFFFFFFAST